MHIKKMDSSIAHVASSVLPCTRHSLVPRKKMDNPDPNQGVNMHFDLHRFLSQSNLEEVLSLSVSANIWMVKWGGTLLQSLLTESTLRVVCVGHLHQSYQRYMAWPGKAATCFSLFSFLSLSLSRGSPAWRRHGQPACSPGATEVWPEACPCARSTRHPRGALPSGAVAISVMGRRGKGI